jgi:hypothetical protein
MSVIDRTMLSPEYCASTTLERHRYYIPIIWSSIDLLRPRFVDKSKIGSRVLGYHEW